MRKLSAAEIITELLRTYWDVACTLNGAGDWIGRGPSSRYLDRPPKHDWHQGSYRELTFVLTRLRDSEPTLYAAVADTYLREHRIIEVRVQRKAKNNRTVTLAERRRVPLRQSDPRLVDAGVAWMVREFEALDLVAQLPREVYAVASA